MKKNFINNKKFYQLIKRFKAGEAELKPEISSILVILVRNFSKTFNNPNCPSCSIVMDDMISDAILKCFMSIHKFNTEYKNPLAFFTQITHNAFLARLTKEKREKDKINNYKDKTTQLFDYV